MPVAAAVKTAPESNITTRPLHWPPAVAAADAAPAASAPTRDTRSLWLDFSRARETFQLLVRPPCAGIDTECSRCATGL